LRSRAARAREMGKIVRLNPKKKFRADDANPAYERYYKRVLEES
jgi:hypothetical protein